MKHSEIIALTDAMAPIVREAIARAVDPLRSQVRAMRMGNGGLDNDGLAEEILLTVKDEVARAIGGDARIAALEARLKTLEVKGV